MNNTSQPEIAVGRFVVTFEEAGARLDRPEHPRPVSLAARTASGRRPFALGRSGAVEAARAFRGGGAQGIAFIGPAGSGKTTLLELLETDPVLRDRYDLFVRVRAAGQPWQDVLAQIFRVLHAGAVPTPLPASNDWLVELRGRRLALALDDADAPFELERLARSLPEATIFATACAALPGLADVPLEPLDERDAGWLFETFRPSEWSERDATRALAALCGGNPLQIKRVAALSAQRSVTDVARVLPSPAALEAYVREAVNRLDARQRGLLDAIGVFGAAAVENDDPGAAKLAAEGLVVAGETGWRIAPELEARYRSVEDFVFRNGLNSCGPTLNGAIAVESDASRLAPVVAAVRRAGELDRFGDVIDLGKITGNALARCGAWIEWRAVLDLVSAAAGRTGADGVQSWVLHQSGTRLACLGQTADAQSTLRAALARRRAARDGVAMRLTEHNLSVIGGRGQGRFIAGGAAVAAAAAIALGATFALRPHVKLVAAQSAASQVVAVQTVATQQVAVQPNATFAATPAARPRALKRAEHPHRAAPQIIAAAAISTVPPGDLPVSAPAESAPPATPHATNAPASPSPRPASPLPSPKVRTTPKARTVALAAKPASQPERFVRPEILAFDATRTLLTAGGSTRLCMSVRDATHVRLTATSHAQTREVPLPPAVHNGKPGCIRIAPKSATRYALHANSGPYQAFRILAVDVFAAPQQPAPAESSAAP